LPGRFAVDVEQHRVFFGGVEVGRQQSPAVELHARRCFDAKELRFHRLEGLQLVAERLVVGEQPYLPVLRQADEFHERRPIESRIGMHRPAGVGRKAVVVRAGLIRGAEPRKLRAVESHAIEILLRGTIG